jgi:hypothetical protein
MLGIGDLLSPDDMHGSTDPEDDQHRRQRDHGQPRPRFTRRVLPVPVPVLDPHERPIGNETPDLYGRRRGP